MRKKKTISARARTLVEQGFGNKAIIEKLQCKPQVVYNARYIVNQRKGLGALKAATPLGTGIATPRRGRTPKTGTVVWTPPPMVPMPDISAHTEPTLWQRVKGWFRGTNP
jgi:hypothetical protein